MLSPLIRCSAAEGLAEASLSGVGFVSRCQPVPHNAVPGPSRYRTVRSGEGTTNKDRPSRADLNADARGDERSRETADCSESKCDGVGPSGEVELSEDEDAE